MHHCDRNTIAIARGSNRSRGPRLGDSVSDFLRVPPASHFDLGATVVQLAPESKCLARNNKSPDAIKATKKGEHRAKRDPSLCSARTDRGQNDDD